MDRFGQVYLEGLNLDQAKDDAAMTVSFETYQYICTGEPHAGEIKEDASLRWTAEKIKSWLSEGMLIFFFCPTPEDMHRMKHLLLSYDLPVQILSPHGFNPGNYRPVGRKSSAYFMGRENFRQFYYSGNEAGFFKRRRNICQKSSPPPRTACAGRLLS